MKNVGGASQNNEQLFKVTCVISWIKYCINNKERQQNNFPNNDGHINNTFHHYVIAEYFVTFVQACTECGDGSGWMEEEGIIMTTGP